MLYFIFSFAIDPSPPDLGGFLYEETEEYIQFRCEFFVTCLLLTLVKCYN